MKHTVSVAKAGPATFRRAGLEFTHKAAKYDLTDEQLAAVTADPMLIVKPKPESAA